ncbi:D-amino-acid transaminase [Lottiidibacillus patelloidae]|uniref:D-alanine aminotransferase n=1 Tax=Lottiidibacillus patelloidae TaxID=2670334 RepID=A0A263BRJ1_9BACI|nr:D-amino-acid transaminase [Lottiidibacillus patelloidae]OZM56188.1 D-amino-acid transaminase [Lottiidibacillus patelloidae]
MLAFYNGEFIESTEKIVSLEDRGYLFGDGVYEVVRIYNGKPFMLEEHLERLKNSAEALHIPMPYSDEEFKQYIAEGLNRLNESNVDIYMQITRGSAPRNHVFDKDIQPVTAMIFRKSKKIADDIRENGGSVLLREDQRWANCYIKSLNLLPNILAKNEAAEKGCYEAIFYKDNVVTEGSASNIFVVKNNELYTTPLHKGILPGITRIAVLKVAKELNIIIHEEFFTPHFLKEADECFVTSTTSEVLPITIVEGEKISNGKVGELTKNIYEGFKELTKK